jgi:hypothetical protein
MALTASKQLVFSKTQKLKLMSEGEGKMWPREKPFSVHLMSTMLVILKVCPQQG